jgi:tetratricopeptide (TPR) repeat protein
VKTFSVKVLISLTRALENWPNPRSRVKVGDVQVEQADLPAALKSYQDALAIADRLAKADPGNAGWQRDLSVSQDKVGDVQVAQGDLPAALKSYQDGLAIRDRLAKADPGNAGWQRDLFVSDINPSSRIRLWKTRFCGFPWGLCI